LGQYPQSESFATLYLAESPVHMKRVKQLSGRTAEDICLAAYSAPQTHGWWRGGRHRFPKNPNPAHGPSGLRPVDQRLLYNELAFLIATPSSCNDTVN